jgi:transcriptional regulator with PAS, ATPase and Fis domain
MPEIALILPYRELTDLAKDIKDENEEQIIIRESLMEDAITIARELENNSGVKIIIARGGTALALKKAKLKSTIIELNITDYDLIEALFEAKKYGNKVGFLGFPNMLKRLTKLSQLLEIKLSKHLLMDISQTKMMLEKMRNDIDVVVGGVITIRWAHKMNINNVLIRTQNATIKNSIQEARNLLNIMHEEQRKREEIQIILNFIKDGVLGVNKSGKILFINGVVSKLIGVDANEVIGKPVYEVFPKSEIMRVLKSGEKEEHQLNKFNEKIFNITRIPIKIKDEVTGAIELLQDVSDIEEVEKNIRKKIYAKGHYAKYKFSDVLGSSNIIKTIIEKAKKYSRVDSNILIYGETGTGKEIFAQSIHNFSNRCKGPFVAINCAALPETLLESELFGYADGAFTGASKGGKKGLIELAHLGTLFLDELSEMTMNVQSRLLRVLEQQEVRKIGDDQVIPVNLRVIAVSNKDLIKLINENKFRKDLYFRLNVLTLNLSPLRDRLEDIDLLVSFFINTISAKLNKEIISISEDALQTLKKHTWPGNIRELKNIIERAVVLCNNNQINKDNIKELLEENYSCPSNNLIDDLDTKQLNSEINNYINSLKLKDISQLLEKLVIEKTLMYNNGNKTKTADDLGINRSTLWRKLKEDY